MNSLVSRVSDEQQARDEQRFYERIACVIARHNAVLVRAAELPGRGESLARGGDNDLTGLDEERDSFDPCPPGLHETAPHGPNDWYPDVP